MPHTYPAGIRVLPRLCQYPDARRRLELPTTEVSLVVLGGGGVRLGGRDGAVGALGAGGAVGGVQVLIEPWLAWKVFGRPVRELLGGDVALSDLVGREGLDLEDALAAAERLEERIRLLLAWLSRRRRAGPPTAIPVRNAWRSLVGTHGRTRITDLVAASDWSAGTLRRRFAQQIGRPPKTTARILRLRHAADLLADGMAAADVAASCGFHDQAHLGHETKALIGLTPAELTASHAADYHQAPQLPKSLQARM